MMVLPPKFFDIAYYGKLISKIGDTPDLDHYLTSFQGNP